MRRHMPLGSQPQLYLTCIPALRRQSALCVARCTAEQALRVMRMLDRYKSPDEAEAGILELLANKGRIFGFGQRAYSTADPRNAINREWANKLSQMSGDRTLFLVAERIEQVMAREKKMFANLDYYTAVIYRLCEIPAELYPPIFLIARVPASSRISRSSAPITA